MEDSIGTIFYIILAVIALVITALNKKRKQKTAQMPTEGKKDAFDPFQAFEEESSEPVVEMPEAMTNFTVETPTVQSELEKIREEGVSAFRTDPSLSEQEEITMKEDSLTADQNDEQEEDWSQAYEARQEEESEIEKIMDEFDLRKAVIHSEIINRKEF